MTILIDPLRHALCIQFGKTQRKSPFRITECAVEGAPVYIALDSHEGRTTLAGIHFVKNGFWLPVIEYEDPFRHCYRRFPSTSEPKREFPSINPTFFVDSGLDQSQYYFLLDQSRAIWTEWKSGSAVLKRCAIHAGLDVLYKMEPQPPIPHSSRVRPMLYGFLIDTTVLTPEMDMSEFILEVGRDCLM